MSEKHAATMDPLLSVAPADFPETADPPRRHRGDIMSPEKRSAVMSRIRGRDTGPERAVGMMLAKGGFFHETQARDLPGRPDFVMRDVRLVVLVDGDFWHGWRFNLWRDKLSLKWEAKIAQNRKRDARNLRLLRQQGWKVIRLWEHEVVAAPLICASRIKTAWFRQAEALAVAKSGRGDPETMPEDGAVSPRTLL